MSGWCVWLAVTPANGGRAHAFGVVPLAARHQRLDRGSRPGALVAAEATEGVEPVGGHPRRLPGAAPTSSARH